MKNKIFMYLFFFAALFIIFQYMNEKKIFEDQENKIQKLTKVTSLNDSIINSLETTLMDVNYFTLQGNDNAMTYLENRGMEAVDVERMIQEAILDKNLVDGGNPLVPYEGLSGDMRVNKIKFLNHRWVVADFTDGDYWGEMLVAYFFAEDNTLEFEVLNSVLYQQ